MIYGQVGTRIVTMQNEETGELFNVIEFSCETSNGSLRFHIKPIYAKNLAEIILNQCSQINEAQE